jgi:hypothetical protein
VKAVAARIGRFAAASGFDGVGQNPYRETATPHFSSGFVRKTIPQNVPGNTISKSQPVWLTTRSSKASAALQSSVSLPMPDVIPYTSEERSCGKTRGAMPDSDSAKASEAL